MSEVKKVIGGSEFIEMMDLNENKIRVFNWNKNEIDVEMSNDTGDFAEFSLDPEKVRDLVTHLQSWLDTRSLQVKGE